MNKSEQAALIRQLREAATELTPGKRRDVLNKLDRIEFYLFKSKSAPANNKAVAPEIEGQGEHFESQAKAVLAWMLEGHTITSLEALRRFGIISFPRRILDIEKLTGVAPKRKRIQTTNRYGKVVYCNEYWLDPGDIEVQGKLFETN